MELREQYKRHESYILDQRLDRLIDFNIDSVSGKDKTKPPKPDDLVRLHKYIRKRKSYTILEFGVGYSTIVMADALFKNQKDWNQSKNKPKIKNRFMIKLFSVDASQYFIEKTRERIPDYLAELVQFQLSEVEISTFNGQICHYYCNIPDIVPDFIYLDGPSPKDVKGRVSGLSFQCDERTVMSADLLLMEPTLKAGTFLIIDGRNNNVEFLKNNFKRNWCIKKERNASVTSMELSDSTGHYKFVKKLRNIAGQVNKMR